MYTQTKDIDIDQEAEDLPQSQPAVFIVGDVGVNAQYHIVSENTVLFEEKTLKDAVIDMFATYYNFQICYIKYLKPIMLFFQCHIFGIDKVDLKNSPSPLAKFIHLAESVD